MASTERDSQARHDETAQRLLNLFFILNTSPVPLTTTQIVTDTDLGYGSSNRASDERKFRRDRRKLEEQGIFIQEITDALSSEIEESSWAIDREGTYSCGGILSADDVDVLLQGIDEYLSAGPTPLARPLHAVRMRALEAKAHEDGAALGEPEPVSSYQPQLDAVWTAFARRAALTMLYQNAQGDSSKRTVAIYGLFTQGEHTYITGYDDVAGGIRTFRVDRIVRAWRPTKPYTIPADFDIDDYLFFPFDLSDEACTHATFAFPAERSETEVAACTHHRGTLERNGDGCWVWHIDVRDVPAAASLALSHARDGMRPLGPPELCDAWMAALREAVSAYGEEH